MATDDIKRIAKGIGALIATAGAVGLAKVVSDSSNRKKTESNSNVLDKKESESVRQSFDELIQSRDETEQMLRERQVQEQMDEMWALHDAELEELQYTGDNNMDWNIFVRNGYRYSWNPDVGRMWCPQCGPFGFTGGGNILWVKKIQDILHRKK